jgi:tetraacyldisaccharide 4'-kinase
LSQALARCWFGRGPAWLRWSLAPLYPLSLVFRVLVALRRALYRVGLLKAVRLPVPVIVVGNLSVGGSGKTPLALALVDWLRQAGYAPA